MDLIGGMLCGDERKRGGCYTKTDIAKGGVCLCVVKIVTADSGLGSAGRGAVNVKRRQHRRRDAIHNHQCKNKAFFENRIGAHMICKINDFPAKAQIPAVAQFDR